MLHNHGAHKVVEKLGWQREGLLRQETYSHGTVKDVYYVSILREDWLKVNNLTEDQLLLFPNSKHI